MKIYNKIISLVLIMVSLSSCDGFDEGYYKETNVNASLLPEIDFSASQTNIFQGESVSFSNLTNGDKLLYLWTFEEGSPTSSADPNPEVTYFSTGIFKVTLKVRNEFGADELTKEGYIVVEEIPIQKQPQDPAVILRLNFEENLGNEGSIETDAETGGALSYSTGIINKSSYVFDGTNPLTIPGYTGINGNGVRSTSLWLKTSHASTSGLVHWGASGTSSRASFKLQNTGVIRFEWQGGGQNGATIVNDDNWHHVAYTYDGSTVKIYVDGVEDAAISGVTLNTGSAGETDVEIGSQLGSSIYQGLMDDVRIYNVALSAGDVEALAKSAKLAVRLNFEGTLYNEGNKDGDIISTGTQVLDTGIINDLSYVFDGTNPLTIPGYTGINGNGVRSTSLWLKTSHASTSGLVHWGASGTSSRASFKLQNTGVIRFEWQGGGQNGATIVNDDNWHHVAYTYDGSTVKIYVDGVEDAAISGVTLNTGSAGETDVEIGSQLGSSIYQGLMDDVRIYESALSSEAVAALSKQ